MPSLNFHNVDTLCHNTDLTSETPVIDLSGYDFISPFAIVYLGMFIRHHAALGRQINLVPPRNVDVRNYLSKQNFWKRFHFDVSAWGSTLDHRHHSTSLNDCIDLPSREGLEDDVSEMVKSVLWENRANFDYDSIGTVVAELVHNFVDHALVDSAGSSSGPTARVGAMLMQYFPNVRNLHLAIGDCGVGIRTSLSANPLYMNFAQQGHNVAINKAMEMGVSRRIKGGGGMGFTEVQDAIDATGGTLTVVSGDGFARYHRNGVRHGRMQNELTGVQIQVIIPAR